MAKRYASTGEAAAYLGINSQTLRNWVANGLVKPTFRTPRRGDMRWDLDDLDRQLHQPHGRPPAQTEGTPVPEPQAADKPQYPAVAVAIVTSRLGVLTGKRNDGKPPWTFIAGKCEAGESPADAIVREVKEETGLLVRAKHTIGERIHPKTGKHLVYVAAIPAGRSRDVFVGDPEELAEVRWLTLYEADQLMPDMYAPVREYLGRTMTNPQAKGSHLRKSA
jgi:8-oxo-dGTP pyrophosphatase MutT (NUDIX family)